MLLGVGQVNERWGDDREQSPEDEYHHKRPPTHRSARKESEAEEETESCSFRRVLFLQLFLTHWKNEGRRPAPIH